MPRYGSNSDLTDSQRMVLQSNLSRLAAAEQEYWQWLRQNQMQHNSQRWQMFLRQWEGEQEKLREQRAIENAKKQYEALSPMRIKEHEETARKSADIQMEKALELEKRKPWDPMQDPYSRAIRDYSAEKARSAMAGREILKDPMFGPYIANTMGSIESGLRDKNVKDPTAVELRGIMDQYATPDEHDWLRKGVAQAHIGGEDPKERLIRDLYIMRNQGDPSKLVQHQGQWVRPGDLKDAGGWLTSGYKRLPEGYQGIRASLSDLTPIQQAQQAAAEVEPPSKVPKPAADEEAAIYKDVRQNFHKYQPRQWTPKQTYFLQQGAPSEFLSKQLFGDEPTRAGHQGWLNAVKDEAIEREQARRGAMPVPSGWRQGAGTRQYYNESGETFDPRSRIGLMNPESAEDWTRGVKGASYAPVERAEVPRDNSIAEFVKGEPPIKPFEDMPREEQQRHIPIESAPPERGRTIGSEWDSAPDTRMASWRDELDELRKKLFGDAGQSWLDYYLG